MKVQWLGLLLLFSTQIWAGDHQMIDSLGISPKGQYIALEEYGYKNDKHTYYVEIKIMNVWKKEYVGSTTKVELPAHRPEYLTKARLRAKSLASEELKKFNISG